MRTSLIARLALVGCLAAPVLAAQAPAPDGKALYTKNCQACHGPRGVPSAALAKQMKIPAFDAAFVAARSADSVEAVIKHGGKSMKGFAGRLTPDEVKAVAAYVRELAPAKAG